MLALTAAVLMQAYVSEPAEWDAGELPGDTRRTLEIVIRGPEGRIRASLPSCRCLSVELLQAEVPARVRILLDTLRLRGPVEGGVTFVFDEKGERTFTFPVYFEVATTQPPAPGTQPQLLLFYDGWSWDAQRAIDRVSMLAQSNALTHEILNLERAANAQRLRVLGHDRAVGLVLIEGGRTHASADAVRAWAEGFEGRVEPPTWDLGEVVSGRTFAREVRVSGGRLRAAIPSCPCFRARILSESVVRVDVDTTGLSGAQDKPIEFVLDGDRRARMYVRFDALGERPETSPEIELIYSGRRPEWPVLTQDVAAIARARKATCAIRMAERPGGTRRRAELGLGRVELLLRDGDRAWSGALEVNRVVAELKRSLGLNASPPPPAPAVAGAIKVRLFYYASCPSCGPLLAKLRARKGVELELLELDRLENVRLLLSLQEGLGVKETRVPVAAAGPRLLMGLDAIGRELEPTLAAIERGELANRDLLATAPAAEGKVRPLPLAVVVAAGLVDGVNPCAFVTAVFLVGFLAFVKRRPAEILAAGATYAAAVYATYFAIGWGALAVLRTLAVYPTVSVWIYRATALAVLVLAVLSVRDAAVYGRTRDAARVWLQLPLGLKKRIHGAVRSGFGTVGFLAGAAVAGFLVTLFETVCTGQIYLPTLVLMARESGRYGLLAIYNAAFVVPLVAVLALAYAGVTSDRLARFSENNVVAAKLMAAALYAGLGIYLIAGLL